MPEKIRQDDLQYVCDLGLIRLKPQVEIANPIYREVIPRELTFSTQVTIAHQSHWYIDESSGLILMDKLLTAFQQFYREHSEAWMDGYPFDPNSKQRMVIELKRLRPKDGAETILEQGLQQTANYMDTCNATEGHLMIVDQRPNRSWDERIYKKEHSCDSKRITVWGL